MATRIATANYFQRNVAQLQTRQANLDRAQLELSTGKKIINPSDDPTGANTVIRLKKEIQVSDRYLASQDSARRYNSVSETQLDSMTNTLYRSQELLTQAINGAYDSAALQALGNEIGARVSEFMGQVNATNSAGDYIFSGYQTTSPAYEIDQFGFAQYQGDEGIRDLLIAPNTYVDANATGNAFVDNLTSDYGYFTPSSDKLSTGTVTNPSAFRSPAFPETTYQIQFNATGDGYDIIDLGLDPANQVLDSVTGYLPGDEITVQGITFQTNGSNPPVAGETIDLSPQRDSELSNFEVNFTAAGEYEIVDLDRNKVVAGPVPFVMGDTIEWGGRKFPSDPAAALPAVGTSFTFGEPTKNTQWVMSQASNSMTINGSRFVATANDEALNSVDLNTPPGDLLPPDHPLYTPGTSGSMVIPANTGTGILSGGIVLYPEDNVIGDFRISFIDTIGDGVADSVRMDEIDPVTKRIKPQPEGQSFDTEFTSGEAIVVAGIEYEVTGTPAVGDTFEVARPENSRRVEVLGMLLHELDQGLVTTGNTRSEIGSRLNIVDNMEQAQLNFQSITISTLATLEEVDIYEAVNNLETSKVALQAAQQSFVKIQNLSLFNYL
ncbi:flagellar hook-associated protein FlgL [Psychrosphaera sp. B3R10]|nr:MULTISPECIES: flagellar hook-associated protein FlgL [unclassified Psychrosphaera]MBU2884066.1 flagellar hook-associated protein FlgL [Psychrosphaera sp. I2R16]MBU2988196.1 flagellar hook-associated protein FlgL [Psychrosphaera sp. B3R10]